METVTAYKVCGKLYEDKGVATAKEHETMLMAPLKGMKSTIEAVPVVEFLMREKKAAVRFAQAILYINDYEVTPEGGEDE